MPEPAGSSWFFEFLKVLHTMLIIDSNCNNGSFQVLHCTPDAATHNTVLLFFFQVNILFMSHAVLSRVVYLGKGRSPTGVWGHVQS